MKGHLNWALVRDQNASLLTAVYSCAKGYQQFQLQTHTSEPLILLFCLVLGFCGVATQHFQCLQPLGLVPWALKWSQVLTSNASATARSNSVKAQRSNLCYSQVKLPHRVLGMHSMVWNPDQLVQDHPIPALHLPPATYSCDFHTDWQRTLPQLPLKLGRNIPVMDVWRSLTSTLW